MAIMDEHIEQLESLTNEFVAHIDQILYEEILSFIEKREKIVKGLSGKFRSNSLTSEQKQRIQAILNHDTLITKKMADIKQEASTELQRIRQSRMQHNTYDKAYTADSYFFDRKK